jgi:hypothetical protein
LNRPTKELKDFEKMHIHYQIDNVRRLVRRCAEERMPQGPCKFCLEIYRAAINKAIDLGFWED